MRLLPVSALTLIAGISAASATTITETTFDFVTLLGQPNDIATSGTFNFDKFTASLGTLTAVQMYVGHFYTSTIQVSNPTGAPVPAIVDSVMNLTLIGGAGLPLASNVASTSAPQHSVVPLLEGETKTLTHADLYLSIPPYDLTNFAAVTGAGKFSIDYDVGAGSLITGADGSSVISAGIEVMIQYTYSTPDVEETPIGPALPMLGSALLLLLPLRRRRD